MTRDEAIAKLVASGKYTPETAAAALDARKANKAEAPKKGATPAKAKAAPVAKPADPASEDVTDVGAVAAPGSYGLGGARHRMEDREDAALVDRQAGHYSTADRLAGRGATGQDVAEDYGRGVATAEQQRADRASQVDTMLSYPGRAVRWAQSLRAPERTDDLADELARHSAPSAGPTPLDVANAWTERSIDLAKNGPRPAPPSKGFTPTVTYEVGEDSDMAYVVSQGYSPEELKGRDIKAIARALRAQSDR